LPRRSRVSSASRRSRPSLFKPEGNEFRAPPPREVGIIVEVVLFSVFVLSRATHPSIVKNAKKNEEYSEVTPPLIECIFSLALGQAIAYAKGGLPAWRKIWDPKPMIVFSLIGVIYALGDILEVLALGTTISGSLYQVLNQSKLIVTAFLMYVIKGTRQTRLQWIILVLVTMSVVIFGLVSKGPDNGDSKGFARGIIFIVLKVLTSCLSAVLSDKYMKDFKDEQIYVQIVQFKCSWLFTLFFYTLVDIFFTNRTWNFTQRSGPFHGWDSSVLMVLASFISKCWLTMYLLALLDSVLKNIGEATSVLVILVLDVYLFKSFEKQGEELVLNFLAVMVVTLSVAAYIDAKGVVEKARAWDDEHPLG